MRYAPSKSILGGFFLSLGMTVLFYLALSQWMQPMTKYRFRNNNFPETFISSIHVDLTSPNQWVSLEWSGPQASTQDTGPFKSSTGRGWGTNDCNDPVESNCLNSRCTPKGTRPVEGFLTHLRSNPEARYVTLIDAKRAIGIHRSPEVPSRPASQGCVRLTEYPARLIYDNSIAQKTMVAVDGEWSLPDLAEQTQNK